MILVPACLWAKSSSVWIAEGVLNSYLESSFHSYLSCTHAIRVCALDIGHVISSLDSGSPRKKLHENLWSQSIFLTIFWEFVVPPTHPNPTVEWTSYPLSISFCLLNLVSREILWNVFIKCTYFQGQLLLVPLWNVENEAHFSGISVTPITFDAHSGMNAVVPSWLFLFGILFFQCSDEEEKELRSTWTSKPWRVEPTHTHLHSSNTSRYQIQSHYLCSFLSLPNLFSKIESITFSSECNTGRNLLLKSQNTCEWQALQPSQLVLQQFIIMVQLGINKGSRYGDPEVMIQ